MFIAEADPAHIGNVWRCVRAMFVRAADMIGAVPALAVLAALTRVRQRQIASRIALVEVIVRKLIFIQAAQMRRDEHCAAQDSRLPRLEIVTPAAPGWSARCRARIPPSPKLRRTRRAGSPRSNLAPFDPNQPETWRARFKLAPPRDPLARAESSAPRIRALWGATPAPPPPGARPAPGHPAPALLRLALRFEALRRAIADPTPYARRLATTLPRLWRRFPAAAAHYAVATSRPHRCEEGDPRLIVEVIALALLVAPLFVNSS
jgi:hypothetical protein